MSSDQFSEKPLPPDENNSLEEKTGWMIMGAIVLIVVGFLAYVEPWNLIPLIPILPALIFNVLAHANKDPAAPMSKTTDLLIIAGTLGIGGIAFYVFLIVACSNSHS